MTTNIEHTEILNTAIEAAQAAGALALKKQQQLEEIKYKHETDLVTEADFACDQLIRNYITNKFPSHNLITEELDAVETTSEYTWYVDPIDGTINYSRKMPIWGISIGVADRDGLLAGVIYLPALEECYEALRGAGALCNGQTISVSNTDQLRQTFLTTGDFNCGDTQQMGGNNRDKLALREIGASHLQRVKCLGSAALELAYVAAGKMDAAAYIGYYSWDIAAGALLVKEAGGQVSALDGSELNLMGGRALFSNSHLHQKLLGVYEGLG